MRYSTIALTLTILMDVITFLNFFNWYEDAVYEYEERQLDLQVNYCVDAAAQEMLINTPILYTDYATWGSMQVDPELAYETYMVMLLNNLGWNDIEENRLALESESIPFFSVAAYDGYYVMLKEPVVTYTDLDSGTVENIEYKLKWTPKIPYSQEGKFDFNGDGTITSDEECIFFFNLGRNYYGTYNLNDNSIAYDHAFKTGPGGELYDSNGVAYDPMLSRQKICVSNRLNAILNRALFNGTEGKVNNEIWIPADYGNFFLTNPIERPTVITMFLPSQGYYGQQVMTFGLGGARIQEANFVICYNINGVAYYTYSRFRDDVESRTDVLEVLTSPMEAAEKGYYFDYTYINDDYRRGGI